MSSPASYRFGENDAERMLSDMEFGLDEHPSERELKLQVGETD